MPYVTVTNSRVLHSVWGAKYARRPLPGWSEGSAGFGKEGSSGPEDVFDESPADQEMRTRIYPTARSGSDLAKGSRGGSRPGRPGQGGTTKVVLINICHKQSDFTEFLLLIFSGFLSLCAWILPIIYAHSRPSVQCPQTELHKSLIEFEPQMHHDYAIPVSPKATASVPSLGEQQQVNQELLRLRVRRNCYAGNWNILYCNDSLSPLSSEENAKLKRRNRELERKKAEAVPPNLTGQYK